MMKKILIVSVALLCGWVTAAEMNAQTVESESKAERYLRLSKEADENPRDWKAQLEVIHILTDKESGFYNQHRATRYLENIYHTATDYNKEMPDSVISQTIVALMTLASDKKDLDKALFYIDELKRAEKVGVEIPFSDILSFDVMGIVYNLAKNDALKALSDMLDMRKRVAEREMSGLEITDAMTAMLFDNLMAQYQKMFGDKLVETTIDEKKYVFIAMKGWNIERPLMGWMGGIGDDDDDKDEEPTLAYGEDGKVYDELHGQMVYSFFCGKNGIEPQEGFNTRLISVTPEQRQQMVDAYRKYIKKNKKSKK